MGAQTRAALNQARALLSGQGGLSLGLAENLFAAAMGLSGSPALRSALSDSASEPSARKKLAAKAFASLSTDAKKVIDQLVTLRWSRAEDLQGALEDLGIRSCAGSAGGKTDLVGELLAISTLVHSNSELELALGSKRASAHNRSSLIGSLLGKKVSGEALAIAQHLVSDPRGRRIGAMLQGAAVTVADHHGTGLALVTVASPLRAPQRSKVEALLHAKYGRGHYVAEVINPDVVGGMKIRVGDDVIDGTIQARLGDLRTKLAG
jgi:F-type H+-transporting ATPase subunit delta